MSNNFRFGSSQPIKATHNIIPPQAIDTLDTVLKQGYDGEEQDILNAAPSPTSDTAPTIDTEYEFVDNTTVHPATTEPSDDIDTKTIDTNDIDSFIKSIDTHFDSYELLQHYSAKLGIKGSNIAGIGSIFLLLTTARFAGLIALVHTCIWLYGSYTTYKSLVLVAQQNGNTTQQNNAITQPILCFWSIYMLFRVGEYVSDTILYTLVFRSSSLYTLSKIILLCYIMLPPSNAYLTIYDKYICSLFDRYEDSIHEYSYNTFTVISNLALEIQTVLFSALGQYLRNRSIQSQSIDT